MFYGVVLYFSYQDVLKNSNIQIYEVFHSALHNLIYRF